MGATACFLGSELPIYMVSRQSRGGCLLTCHRGFAVVAIFSHACISLQFVFCLHVPKRISEWEDLWIANATSMSHAGAGCLFASCLLLKKGNIARGLAEMSLQELDCHLHSACRCSCSACHVTACITLLGISGTQQKAQ